MGLTYDDPNRAICCIERCQKELPASVHFILLFSTGLRRRAHARATCRPGGWTPGRSAAHSPRTPTSGAASLPWRQRAVRVARSDRKRTRRRRRSWASPPHRPTTSDASTTSGYRASLRRRATWIAAPSRSRLPGCTLPSARKGDTSVTSQHSASPRLVAPYKTKSSRRRSSAGIPGAVVCTSQCWGTTRLSAPTASRATRTHARSRIGARRASRPLRAQAAR